MADITYRLADSAIRVKAQRSTTSEQDETGAQRKSRPEITDVEFELIHRAAEMEVWKRSLDVGSGDAEPQLHLTPDGRLQSVEHRATGAGATIIAAGARLLAFAAQVSLTVGRAGGLAAQSEPVPKSLRTPPELRAAWTGAVPDQASLLESYEHLVSKAAIELVSVRNAIVDATDPAALRSLLARERAVDRALDDGRAEIDKIEIVYRAWVARQRSTTIGTVETLVDIEKMPSHHDEVPTIEAISNSRLAELWREFGVFLEVIDTRRVHHVDGTHRPSLGDAGSDSQRIRWRVPRRVELVVWRNDSGTVSLVSRAPVWITDERSDTEAIELRSRLFGENGGSLSFNDDGSPASIQVSRQSTVAAALEAVAVVPDVVVGAAEQAQKLTDTLGAVRDAEFERERSDVERTLASAQARLDLAGLNATAKDFAALKRAEQAAAMRTALRASSTDSHVDAISDLENELERVTTQRELDDERRDGALDAELAALAADVRRLESELSAASAQRQLPGERDQG